MKHKILLCLAFTLVAFSLKAQVAEPGVKKDIQALVDTFSKKGTAPLTASQATRFADWLKVNGESIQNGKPWKVTGDGPTMADSTKAFTAADYRYIESGDVLYLFVMDVPVQDMRIPGLKTSVGGKIIGSVKLLGSSERMSWEMHEKGLTLEKPKVLPKDGVTVFKITWQEYYKEPPVDNTVRILEN